MLNCSASANIQRILSDKRLHIFDPEPQTLTNKHLGFQDGVVKSFLRQIGDEVQCRDLILKAEAERGSNYTHIARLRADGFFDQKMVHLPQFLAPNYPVTSPDNDVSGIIDLHPFIVLHDAVHKLCTSCQNLSGCSTI